MRQKREPQWAAAGAEIWRHQTELASTASTAPTFFAEATAVCLWAFVFRRRTFRLRCERALEAQRKKNAKRGLLLRQI